MRHFRQLTRTEIADLIDLHGQGWTQTALASKFEIDRSTVSYHVRKFDKSYPEEGSFYAMIKARARKSCAHPSGRCVFCGEMWDMLSRAERETIATLTKALERANSKLRVAGLPVE